MKDTQFGVYVYGMSYEHSQIRQPLYDGVRPVKMMECIFLWLMAVMKAIAR